MLDPPVAPTAANPSRRAAGPFTPRNAHLVTQHEPWYRYVPESGNWHGGTSTRWIAALSAASHIRQHPDELHQGLKIITETTRRFVTQVVQRGADGLFFASQAVDPNYITPEEHAEFAKRYDLQVLEATGGKTWFDIFHLHGREISFDQVLDYPVHAFNYHDRDHGPSLRNAQADDQVPSRRHLAWGADREGHAGRGRVGGRGRLESARRTGSDHNARRGREPAFEARQRRPPTHNHRGHTAGIVPAD